MKGGSRRLVTPAIVLVTLVGIYLARHVLVPFLLALVLAYALNPVVAWLERRGISRSYGALLVMLGLLVGMVVAFVIAVPEVISQIRHFMDRLPGYLQFAREALAPLESYLNEHFPSQLESLRSKSLEAAQQALPSALGWVAAGFSGIAASTTGLMIWLVTVVIIPVFAYYVLADFAEIRAALAELIPAQVRPGLDRRVAEVDKVLRTWLKGQLIVAATLAVIYAVGLTLLKVPIGLLIGIVGGLANLVPYLGLVLGFIPAALLSFLDTGSWLSPVLVAGVFVLGQVLEGTVITPRVVGGSLGMPPVLVLLAVMIGGELFGFTGLLLAVPATAAGLVLLKEHTASSAKKATGASASGGGSPPPRRPTRRRRPLA